LCPLDRVAKGLKFPWEVKLGILEIFSKWRPDSEFSQNGAQIQSFLKMESRFRVFSKWSPDSEFSQNGAQIQSFLKMEPRFRVFSKWRPGSEFSQNGLFSLSPDCF